MEPPGLDGVTGHNTGATAGPVRGRLKTRDRRTAVAGDLRDRGAAPTRSPQGAARGAESDALPPRAGTRSAARQGGAWGHRGQWRASREGRGFPAARRENVTAHGGRGQRRPGGALTRRRAQALLGDPVA